MPLTTVGFRLGVAPRRSQHAPHRATGPHAVPRRRVSRRGDSGNIAPMTIALRFALIPVILGGGVVALAQDDVAAGPGALPASIRGAYSDPKPFWNKGAKLNE